MRYITGDDVREAYAMFYLDHGVSQPKFNAVAFALNQKVRRELVRRSKEVVREIEEIKHEKILSR